ncbi:hypothetical protein Trco_005069 [Trichoderma cornu-damae]|uniref:Uncharacterized protein n=1 Tax=Trichoderma cornu-damae TaxID=654480 RepID=A0A9P8TSD6_9HYPO|nr:hypothetical protein Trco_005069 [Trichoderma cornu-damae]
MPDLNSVPPSPRVLASGTASRRQSANLQTGSSPPGTQSSVNILPSNQAAVNQRSPSHSQPLPPPGFPPPQSPMGHSADAAVGPGPGPLRHPRPLTASELHMQLEKEQEAVVNRLTRELSLLRAAHNASVVSNASSTSNATSHDPIVESSLLSGSGFSIPTARRHHRTSSSTSQTLPNFASSYEARARTSHPVSLSRQNSSASRRSQTGSPAPSSSIDPSNYFHQQRNPAAASSAMMSSVVATPGGSVLGDQMSPGLLPATLRYEETAFYRQELDNAKKENEALKRRIRELERIVRERRSSDASRNRSDSASTTASASIAPGGGVSIAGPRESIYGHGRDRERAMQSTTSLAGGVSIGVPDEEVKVGESAASGRSGNESQR